MPLSVRNILTRRGNPPSKNKTKGQISVKNKNFRIAYGAIIAAVYAVLTYLQNLLVPGSASMTVQFRASEILNVTAIFTPAAIPGLTLGCLISNTFSAASGLPLDMIFGSAATLGSAVCMYLFRNIKIREFPLLSMLMPVLWNGLIVGWEIEYFFVEGPFEWVGFLTCGAFVALGEAVVMMIPGTALYYAVRKRKMKL